MEQPKKSQSCELYSSKKEIHNYHGVVHSVISHGKEDDQQLNGTLSLIQESDKVVIEWRPNDVSIDTECQEDTEWALVNTNTRTRTSSGSVDGALTKLHVNIMLNDVKTIKVSNKKNKLTFSLKDNKQKVFFFHFGNVNQFFEELRTLVTLKRSHHDSNLYFVHDKNSIVQSFSDLTLVDKGGDTVWNLVGDLKRRPYETTLSTFSKLTELLLYRSPETRHEGAMVEILSSLSSTDGCPEVDESYHFICPVLGPRKLDPRGPPLSLDQWESAKDDEGRIINPDLIKEIIFKGGITPCLRSELWKYLLCLYPWNSTSNEREEILNKKSEEYKRMKAQWSTMSADQESRFTFFRDKKSLVEKDVNRTDRTMPFYAGANNPNLELLSDILMTYVMYNFDLGYVQGMSDLLSPILAVLGSEVEAFWCFVGFMNIMYHNFDEDQSGMKKQLSQLHTLLTAVAPDLATYLDSHDSGSMCFCFRWLLVWFKREFTLEDVNILWEVLWTGLPCSNFHLLICVAILEKEKAKLMSAGNGLSEVLKHVNDLSYHMDLNDILMRATGIYNQLDQSSNLTASTQRVLGLAHDLITLKQNKSETEEIVKGVNIDDSMENGYDKSIEFNYF